MVGEPDDDSTSINILASEVMCEVEGSGISSDQFLKPLKIKKVNIGLPKNLKFTNIGDYWDDEMVSQTTDFLHEFQDLFPTNFSEMKGIVGYMGEMKIPLKQTQNIKGSGISSDQFLKPLKIKKVNIGSPENLKFTNIGDYWDDETVSKITDLLHEYQDLFPTNFIEIEGIMGDLGEMKIPLKLDAKHFKQRPYRLNPRYK